MNKVKGFAKMSDILDRFQTDRDKYISVEFQKYGYDLAQELGDMKNKSLYIKLAKTTPRAYLENAKNFVKDAYNVKNKARLFMWKLQQLRSGIKPEPFKKTGWTKTPEKEPEKSQ